MVHIRARMSVLLHICCAPCSISCIEMLREEGMEPTGFWFNPNIHPYKEYQARKDTLVEYAAKIGLKLIMRDEYGLRPFIRAIYPSLENRCGTCYRIRFEETARFAAKGQGTPAVHAEVLRMRLQRRGTLPEKEITPFYQAFAFSP